MEINLIVRCVDGDGKPVWPDLLPEAYVLPDQGWAALSAISASFDHNQTVDALLWKGAFEPAVRGRPAASFAGFRLVDQRRNAAEINVAPKIEWTNGVLTLDFGTIIIAPIATTPRSRIVAPSFVQVEPPKTLDEAIRRLATTETELSAIKARAAAKQPAASVFSALGSSIGEAANQIAQQQHPFMLGPVTIKLMGSVSDGGTTIQMADSVSADAAHSISEIAMVFEPTDLSSSNSDGALTVPNLLGLTQSAAIEALAGSGLKHRSATTLLKPKRKAEHGRAIEQIPASGTLAEIGAEILVVYGFLEMAS